MHGSFFIFARTSTPALCLAKPFPQCFSIYFPALPAIVYFRDPNGLRKFPQLSLWSGITDWPYMRESQNGSRSRSFLTKRRDHPVLRIDPNSLSYSDVRAIKDIHRHGIPCIKDRFYEELGGSHTYLADVVDNQRMYGRGKLYQVHTL